MKNKYEIRGDVTAIFLKKRDGTILETIIDTNDLNIAINNKNTWLASWSKSTNSYYVLTAKQFNFKRKAILLHRLILNAGDEFVVDHFNNDTLDNRRSCNLRIATNAENTQNKKGASRTSKTGIRGVMWDEKNGRWRAKVEVNGKTYFKRFKNKENAIKFVKKIRSEKMLFSKEFGKTIGDIPDELPVNNSSGYRGVSWNNASKKWKATLKYKKKKYHLGYFKEPEKAYDEILKKKQEILVSEERNGA